MPTLPDIYWINPVGSPISMGEYWFNVPTEVINTYQNDANASFYKVVDVEAVRKPTYVLRFKNAIEFKQKDGYYMVSPWKPALDYKSGYFVEGLELKK